MKHNMDGEGQGSGAWDPLQGGYRRRKDHKDKRCIKNGGVDAPQPAEEAATAKPIPAHLQLYKERRAAEDRILNAIAEGAEPSAEQQAALDKIRRNYQTKLDELSGGDRNR